MTSASHLDPVAESSRARAAASAGYWSEAYQIFNRLLSEQPGHAEALLGAAQMLRRLKDYPRAEAVLEQAESYYPGDPAFRLEQARLADSQAHHDDALNLLSGLVAEGATDPGIWSGILRSLRLPIASAQGRCRALEEYDHWLWRSLAAFPNHPKVLSECALLCVAIDRPEQAIALLLQANARDLLIETLVELPPAARAEPRASALHLLEAAVRLLPRDWDVLRASAHSLVSLNEDARAAAILETLLAINPSDQDARQLRFECLRRAGLLDLAKAAAEELLQLDPAGTDRRLQLADTLSRMGLFEQACELLASPLEATTLLQMNSDPGALDQLLETVSRRWPEAPELLLAQARLQSTRDQLQSAAWNYGRLLERDFPAVDPQPYRELLLMLRKFGGAAKQGVEQAPPTGGISSADRAPVFRAPNAADSDRGEAVSFRKRSATEETFYQGVAASKSWNNLQAESLHSASLKGSAAQGVQEGWMRRVAEKQKNT